MDSMIDIECSPEVKPRIPMFFPILEWLPEVKSI